jgi:hypothetical protein
MTETCPSCLVEIAVNQDTPIPVEWTVDQDVPEIMLTEKPCVSITSLGASKIKVDNVQLRREDNILYLEPTPTNTVSHEYRTATIVLSVLTIFLIFLAIYLATKK